MSARSASCFSGLDDLRNLRTELRALLQAWLCCASVCHWSRCSDLPPAFGKALVKLLKQDIASRSRSNAQVISGVGYHGIPWPKGMALKGMHAR